MLYAPCATNVDMDEDMINSHEFCDFQILMSPSSQPIILMLDVSSQTLSCQNCVPKHISSSFLYFTSSYVAP
jgi:hypothetical protein